MTWQTDYIRLVPILVIIAVWMLKDLVAELQSVMVSSVLFIKHYSCHRKLQHSIIVYGKSGSCRAGYVLSFIRHQTQWTHSRLPIKRSSLSTGVVMQPALRGPEFFVRLTSTPLSTSLGYQNLIKWIVLLCLQQNMSASYWPIQFFGCVSNQIQSFHL